MAYVNITKENFRELVLDNPKSVLLDFWAVWCGPCRMVAPIVEALSEERQDILVGKINVDEEPELANRFQVMSIPSLFVMEGGQIKNRSVGAKPKAQLLQML